MDSIRAVLFDFDGTLRDSREAIYPSVEHAFRAHGVPLAGREALRPYIHSLKAVHQHLAPHVSYSALEQTYDERMRQLAHTIEIYPGAREVLAELGRLGYKRAMVSSARYAKRGLRRFGLEGHFDAVVGGLDVAQLKPHPEPVLLAVGQLGLRASEAVMVGDLAADVESGRAAGVAATIGLTHGYGSRQDLEAADADYIIDDLHALLPVLEQLHSHNG